MKTLSGGFVRLFTLVMALALVAGVVAVGANPPDGLSQTEVRISPIPESVTDGVFSANGAALFDGTVGADDAVSWSNSANPWTDASYPMLATIDLGQTVELRTLRYYGGQIPYPAEASLTIEVSVTGAQDDFTVAAEAGSPAYDQWSAPLDLGGVHARYLQVGFYSMQARFNVAELAIEGRVPAPTTPPTTLAPGPIDIAGVTVADGVNSVLASRLLDGALGTENGVSWENPQPWNQDAYPMMAIFDLGSSYPLRDISYFVGNLNQGTDQLNLESSSSSTGDDFVPLGTMSDGHQWNSWRDVPLDGRLVRRVRFRFDNPAARFNISEVRFRSDVVPPSTTSSTTPSSTTSSSSTTTPTTVVPTTTTATTTTIAGPTIPAGDQPQPGPPPAGVVRSHGFGTWPSDHLSPSCKTLHDSYWITGPVRTGHPDSVRTEDPDHPDNRAYHTWHPALAVNQETGERCDFGHEHGFNPKLAPTELFDRSGGWPAFGYVAETLGGERHEDHVGHKVTVARFRAAIGNGAGSEPLYDAGFDCDWLSKIHQGSSTMDAFANHLHEYFLTLRCFDGLNAQGTVDNTVVGTNFSVKVMYTYGNPDRFVEEGCIGDDPSTPNVNETEFPASILTGPEGQPVMPAQRVTPLGNDKPNSRAFVCSNSVLWKDLSQVQSIDLWTQLIKIERNTGDTAITIQPYYIVKNPARIVQGYDSSAGERPSQVIRTISLCYDDAGNRLDRPLCEGAPTSQPHWTSPNSPFNGALRAVNFKSSHLQNSGGPAQFCTDPFGFAVQDPVPCESGNVLQQASQFDNHWNDGRYGFGGQQGNIQGSVFAEDPYGNRFAATPIGGGAHRPNGIGFEFIIDNRNPDDDMDGIPDGANIRGRN